MRLLNRISAKQIFLYIAVTYLAGYIAHALYLGKTVYGDGTYYYAWLSGILSKFSIGPALFWAPVYFMTRSEIAVGLTSVAATITALILLWNILQKQFSQTVSIMTIAAVAGTSNLLFYGSIDVVNSHALTFFAATVFLALLLQKQKNWFAVGASLGALGLMRTQDLLYGILLIPVINKGNIVRIIAGLGITFFPQMVAWKVVSGSFWMSPYLKHEGFTLLEPHVVSVLLNTTNGLFLWTPVTLIGAIGLITGKKYLMLAVFLLELYTVSTWSTWWQGASYSGRMFVSSLPVLAFGIASVFAWLAKFRWNQAYYILTIVGPLTLLNATSIIYFLLSMPGQ